MIFFLPLCSTLAMGGVAGPPQAAEAEMILSFANPEHARGWQTVNDTVMGGISESRFSVRNGIAVFTGSVSLEHNGGFASVRSSERVWCSQPTEALLLRVRGDGKRYKLTLRTDAGFSTPTYQLAFETRAGQWQDLRLPLRDFEPSFRGRRVAGVGPIDPTQARILGFLVSDKQAGEFVLEIDWVRAVD